MVRIEFEAPLTSALRVRLLDVWIAATNEGGALGLLEPADAESARPVAEATWARIEAGTDALVVLCDGLGVLGWVVLASNASPLERHWRTVRRLQVHPDHQGKGHGTLLLLGAEEQARALGVEALHLTVRGGTGTEAFYERLGYVQVGRIPAALRVAPGDDRDQLYLVKTLTRM